MSRARAAAAGAAATVAWAAFEQVDRRVLRHDYTDVALLGKAVTRSRAWPVAGLALHAANGAVFGLVFDAVRSRTQIGQHRLALGLALGEHLALFPLGALVDRFHPARGEPGVVGVFSKPAFVQATARHALFGAVLGRLA
jgi:hypothetical protein